MAIVFKILSPSTWNKAAAADLFVFQLDALRRKYEELERELTDSYERVDKKLETYQEDTLSHAVDPILHKITEIGNMNASFHIVSLHRICSVVRFWSSRFPFFQGKTTQNKPHKPYQLYAQNLCQCVIIDELALNTDYRDYHWFNSSWKLTVIGWSRRRSSSPLEPYPLWVCCLRRTSSLL